jgi:Zn-dependent alcohol dehydrogenase
MRMIAAVMYEQGLPAPYAESLPFRIEEVELEGPGENEVRACAIPTCLRLRACASGACRWSAGMKARGSCARSGGG